MKRKTYRPVLNLYFLSKIQKVISNSILGHILDNNNVDSFQSAYKAGHSVVRRVYFVCTMILSQPLTMAIDHFRYSRCVHR